MLRRGRAQRSPSAASKANLWAAGSTLPPSKEWHRVPHLDNIAYLEMHGYGGSVGPRKNDVDRTFETEKRDRETDS